MTSSEGTLLQDTYNSYCRPEKESDSSPPEDESLPADKEVPEAGLEITTSPEYADVYVNNSYQGSAPVSLRDIPPGQYKIFVEAAGYYAETLYWNYGGGLEEVSISLAPIVGYLVVDVNIPGAEVEVTGYFSNLFPLQLPVGSHRLKVRAFGYTEHVQYIDIKENQTTYAEVELLPAPFEIQGLAAGRRMFNPQNGGLLGTTSFHFQVTSSGFARLAILDSAGRLVREFEFSAFTTWKQSCRWDGADNSGKLLADGVYRVVLDGWGHGEESGSRLETEVVIDRRYSLSPLMLWSGISGLLYAAAPDVLPPFGFQISAHVLVTGDRDSLGNPVYIAPLNSGFRLGLPGSGELSLSYSPVLISKDVLPFTLAGSYKRRLFSVGFNRVLQGALTARGTYVHGTNTDTYTNYTGLTLGLPLAIGRGAVVLYFSPELTLSPFEVIYGSAEAQIPGFHTWFYGKLGLRLDLGSVVAGLSGAVRTASLENGLALAPPYNAACELHFLIPGTELFVTLAGAMEFIHVDNFYINYGVGIMALH